MTKQELLTDLASKADVLNVGTPELVNTIDNVTRYNVPVVLDKGNNLVLGASQTILVIDEGVTGEESAYYNIKKNFSHEQVREKSQLQTDAEAYLDTQLKKTWGAGKLLKYQIDSVNEEQAHVKATGYTDAGTEEQGIVFFDDASSAWTHQILT